MSPNFADILQAVAQRSLAARLAPEPDAGSFVPAGAASYPQQGTSFDWGQIAQQMPAPPPQPSIAYVEPAPAAIVDPAQVASMVRPQAAMTDVPMDVLPPLPVGRSQSLASADGATAVTQQEQPKPKFAPVQGAEGRYIYEEPDGGAIEVDVKTGAGRFRPPQSRGWMTLGEGYTPQSPVVSPGLQQLIADMRSRFEKEYDTYSAATPPPPDWASGTLPLPEGGQAPAYYDPESNQVYYTMPGTDVPMILPVQDIESDDTYAPWRESLPALMESSVKKYQEQKAAADKKLVEDYSSAIGGLPRSFRFTGEALGLPRSVDELPLDRLEPVFDESGKNIVDIKVPTTEYPAADTLVRRVLEDYARQMNLVLPSVTEAYDQMAGRETEQEQVIASAEKQLNEAVARGADEAEVKRLQAVLDDARAGVRKISAGGTDATVSLDMGDPQSAYQNRPVGVTRGATVLAGGDYQDFLNNLRNEAWSRIRSSQIESIPRDADYTDMAYQNLARVAELAGQDPSALRGADKATVRYAKVGSGQIVEEQTNVLNDMRSVREAYDVIKADVANQLATGKTGMGPDARKAWEGMSGILQKYTGSISTIVPTPTGERVGVRVVGVPPEKEASYRARMQEATTRPGSFPSGALFDPLTGHVLPFNTKPRDYTVPVKDQRPNAVTERPPGGPQAPAPDVWFPVLDVPNSSGGRRFVQGGPAAVLSNIAEAANQTINGIQAALSVPTAGDNYLRLNFDLLQNSGAAQGGDADRSISAFEQDINSYFAAPGQQGKDRRRKFASYLLRAGFGEMANQYGTGLFESMLADKNQDTSKFEESLGASRRDGDTRKGLSKAPNANAQSAWNNFSSQLESVFPDKGSRQQALEYLYTYIGTLRDWVQRGGDGIKYDANTPVPTAAPYVGNKMALMNKVGDAIQPSKTTAEQDTLFALMVNGIMGNQKELLDIVDDAFADNGNFSKSIPLNTGAVIDVVNPSTGQTEKRRVTNQGKKEFYQSAALYLMLNSLFNKNKAVRRPTPR